MSPPPIIQHPSNMFTDPPISTYFLTPQANPGSPPPINWSTRPRKTQHNTGTLDSSQDPTVADSATDESSKQLVLLLSYLSLSHSIGVVDIGSQQDSSNVHGVESSTSVDDPIAIAYEFESQDRLHS